jgi:hypothetical protein
MQIQEAAFHRPPEEELDRPSTADTTSVIVGSQTSGKPNNSVEAADLVMSERPCRTDCASAK